ncbi:MAG TPA: hypothetical protein VJ824_13820 [Bacillota bacterium]|nr:hypothetical protein [Bacillota bacterium]
MKSLFTSRYVLVTIASVISIFVLIGGYYAWIAPQKQQLEQLDSQIKSNKKLLATLQQKQQDNQVTSAENTKRIQSQLPVKSLEDQFLLALQNAELRSDSYIQSIGITDGKQQLADEQKPKQEAKANNAQGNGQPNQGNQNQVSQPSPTSAPLTTNQPTSGSNTGGNVQSNAILASLKSMTFNLEMKSPDYDHLSLFLRELENLPRITSIDSLTFTGVKETSDGQLSKEMNYNLTVSIYYAPQLTDLIKDIPVVEYPQPKNKENPIYPGGEKNDEEKSKP